MIGEDSVFVGKCLLLHPSIHETFVPLSLEKPICPVESARDCGVYLATFDSHRYHQSARVWLFCGSIGVVRNRVPFDLGFLLVVAAAALISPTGAVVDTTA